MNISGNTILITGGGTGIGEGLAAALHAAGNQVIITGRNRAALERTATAHPGMAHEVLDIGSHAEIAGVTAKIVAAFPALNILINNAGIMRAEDLLAMPGTTADAEEMVTTNLLGPIRLTAALLPQRDFGVDWPASGCAPLIPPQPPVTISRPASDPPKCCCPAAAKVW